MASNFQKRQSKTKVEETEVADLVLTTADEESRVEVGALPQYAYDIFLAEGSRGHQLVTIAYDPATNEARVIGTQPIERNVGLGFGHQKKALTLLKNR